MKDIKKRIALLQAIEEINEEIERHIENAKINADYYLSDGYDDTGNPKKITPEELKEQNKYRYDTYLEYMYKVEGFEQIIKELEKMI